MRPVILGLLSALPVLMLTAMVARERRDVDGAWADWRQEQDLRQAGRGR